MDTLLEHTKAILATVFGFLVYAATRITADESLLPSLDPFDLRGWLLLILGLVAGYATVSVVPNITRDRARAQHTSAVYRPRKRRKVKVATPAETPVAKADTPTAEGPPLDR